MCIPEVVHVYEDGFGDSAYIFPPTSYDYKSGTISPDPAEQAEQCLKNIASALAEAGATLDEVVRVRYIFPERTDFPKCWDVLHKYLGGARPAATMLVAGLMEEAMKVEIEVTARKGSASASARATTAGDAPPL